MSTVLTAAAELPTPQESQPSASDAGRPEASGSVAVLAELAEPALMVCETASAAHVSRLFRQDAALRCVVLDVPGEPRLVERSWFELTMSGRAGAGRLVSAGRPLRRMPLPNTLVLDAMTPLTHAAAEVTTRQSAGTAVDAVVIRSNDGEIQVVRVAAIFERLARHHAFQAMHDPLTGLPNRLFLMERLQQAADHGGVLLYIDLDRFKDVNDEWGHAAGDEVLVQFAHRLRALSRAHDLIARIGGDEFVLLTDGALDSAAAGALAQRLIADAALPFTVCAASHADDDEEPVAGTVRIGASIGIARRDLGAAATGVAPEMLLQQADLALYRAKSRGRGRVASYDPEVDLSRSADGRVQAERAMERRLRAALDDGALTVHYQPVVELPSGRVTGVEALARWHDSELGMVSPDVFITLAERTGLILDLGRWVLETACKQAAQWTNDALGSGPSVAVNISAVQLAEPSIVDEVTSALRVSGLDPQRLCLEITETAAVGDLEACAARLRALRNLGVRLALDDFGTGHSSLTMLQHLPVHLVKIDRSFVERVTTRALDAVLVRLVIDTAHSLGLRVCAEGVEDAEQARQLTAMGADSAQGWFFGRPEPSSAQLEVRLAGRSGEIGVDLAVEPSLLLGASDELVVVSGPDQIARYVSASSSSILGRTPSEFIGTSLMPHLDPDLVGRIGAGENIPGLTARGSIRHRVRHRDGTYRWLQTNTQFLTDSTDSVREILSISRDVTSAVKAEQAVAESEAKFRHAFDGAPIGMALNELDGTFIRVNHALANLLGYSTEDVLSLRVPDMTHPDDRESDVVNTEALIAGRIDRVAVDKRYLHADGHVVPVTVWASVVADHGNKLAYIVAHVMPR